VQRQRLSTRFITILLPGACQALYPIADQPIASQIAMAGDAVRIQEMDDRRCQDIFFI